MSQIILLDGGMGQELIARSRNPPSPLWSAKVLMDEPELVEAVHREYLAAGAKVLTLNSYSATPERLERDANVDFFEPLQAKAIAIARKVAGRGEQTIAGCLPPLFASYKPELVPDDDICLSTYRRIVALQNDAVDVFKCETLSTINEIRCAVTAAAETGKPVWCAMTVKDGDGEFLRSGERLSEGVEAAKLAGASAVLINCSWPESVSQGLPVLKASGIPFGAYANGFQSIDGLDAGGTVSGLKARQDLDPETYAHHVMGWIDQGATIVGGCCEIGPDHIEKIAERIREAGHEIVGLSS